MPLGSVCSPGCSGSVAPSVSGDFSTSNVKSITHSSPRLGAPGTPREIGVLGSTSSVPSVAPTFGVKVKLTPAHAVPTRPAPVELTWKMPLSGVVQMEPVYAAQLGVRSIELIDIVSVVGVETVVKSRFAGKLVAPMVADCGKFAARPTPAFANAVPLAAAYLSLIHISEPTRQA